MNERERKKIQEINERWAKKEENKPKKKHPWKKQIFPDPLPLREKKDHK